MKTPNILAQRLEQLCKDKKLSHRELAKILGISESYMSEIFKGTKSGRRKVLDFADRLGITSEYLLGGGAILIPMVCEVSAHSPSPMLGEPIEQIDISMLPGIDTERAKGFYAVRVKDDSLLPTFKAGDIIIAEKATGNDLANGDKILITEENMCWLRYIEFAGDMILIRALPSGDKEVFKKSDLAKMHLDKVIYTIAS